MQSTLHWDRTLVLNLPRADVWRMASDTARFNQAVGLPPITFTRAEGRGPSYLLARTRYLGIPLQWYEHPFNWVYQEQFTVVRSFVGTPLRAIRTSMRFADHGPGRTLVAIRVEIAPRTLFGWVAARTMVGSKLLRDAVRVFCGFEDAAAAPVETYPRLERATVRVAELRRLGERLRTTGCDQTLIGRFLSHIEHAPDDAVAAIRPFEIADRWGAPRREVLRLCLHATRIGLLELSWEVLCPNCRVSKAQANTLSAMPAAAHCETCHIEFSARFDDYVELRFAVSPAVRTVQVASYCIGGPANTRHILAQQAMPPGIAHQISLWLSEGSYRIRAPGIADSLQIEVTPNADARQLALTIDDEAMRTSAAELAPGRVTLVVRHRGHRPRLLMVEASAWSAHFASAALVTSLQEFRDLFAAEVLAPGLGLGIRTMTFLFTDLKGSTALYQRIGDAPAFARVRDHFAVLTEATASHGGALVKTIGDAVMAVFSSAADAVAAALAIREGLQTLNARNPGDSPLQVKVGLHCGPCITVNANGRLDYFGTTVNMAARVQGMAGADEIVLTTAVLGDVDVRAYLASHNLHTAAFTAELRGLAGSTELYRLEDDRS
jgi:class 3 adenylate cyclase